MNKHKKIILIGRGGHCKSCIEVIESTNEFTIAGIVDTKDKIGEEILGYKIFACDNDLIELKKNYTYAMITVGQIKSATLRVKLFKNAKKIGFQFPSIIAKTAIVSKYSKIGEGNIFMHQAIISADVEIGSNNIINTKALVEHDTVIGNHNHISTSAVINGNVIIGNECFIGSNSTFVNGINLEDKILIGVNSLVNKNINKAGVYFGSPVKNK